MTVSHKTQLPPKADPETLVLRGSPGRVVRFRRSVVIAIAAIGCAGLAGTAWLALEPASLLIVGDREDGAVPAKAPADALANAPASYGDIPKLGPPLPGDLGRPILAHRSALDAGQGSADERRADAAEAERQRLAAEQRAARQSGVMMTLSGARMSDAVRESDASNVAEATRSIANQAPDLPDHESPARRRADGLMAGEDGTGVSGHRLAPPASPWTLSAGSVIAAGLITGINSDLPGFVTAQVTEHVYDSLTGRTLLIPQGSRLIGSYNKVVAFGQTRALLVWQRLLLPDGSSLRLEDLPATDTAGYAGLSDSVDAHGWQLLKGVALSTLLGAGTELGFGSEESDLVRALRESAQQSGARAGDQLVARQLDVQPTIRVRPGWPLRVVVHKDLVLQPWQQGQR